MEAVAKNEQKLYDDILRSIKEITLICGTENIQDALLDLDDEEFEEYEKQCKNIVNTIGDIVRLQEKSFDFTPLFSEIPDKEFWEDIKEDVERIVRGFLTVIPYRRLDVQNRLKLLEQSFDIIYLQREYKKFLSEVLGDSMLADAVYVVLMESENIIVSNYASKRFFKDALSKKIKLDEKDLDVIWNLYEQNFSTILTIVSLKNHLRLVNHIRHLSDRIDELEGILLTMPEK